MTAHLPSPDGARDWTALVMDAAPSAMLMVDARGTICFVNRTAEQMFGYSRAELVGTPVDRLVPERAREQHGGFVRSFFQTPATRAMGGRRWLSARRKDGSEVPVEIGLNALETADGPFTIASIVDITERLRTESLQQRLAAIVESSDDAILSKTVDGMITSWNRGAEQLLGYAAPEAIGQSILLVVPADRRAEEEELRARVVREGRVARLETKRRAKSGVEIDVAVTLSPLRDALGEVVGVSTIARDFTEQKAREAELSRSNTDLEQFAYVASHDLQEPLRMVANYTELLAERYQGKLDERADKYIHYAADGARRMQRLVSDLLAYSRVGSQGKPRVPVSVDAVLRGVEGSLARLIRDAGALIEVAPLPVVLADEAQLHQLFQNLVTNAIKFRSAAPPRITIAATASREGWHFTVSDNGIGFEMKYAERIFMMFQRLHERGAYEGSGIGLAIVKRIVERHGGRIWVESAAGAGTTFHFTLPRAPVPA